MSEKKREKGGVERERQRERGERWDREGGKEKEERGRIEPQESYRTTDHARLTMPEAGVWTEQRTI